VSGREQRRRYRARQREAVFDHYGRACACCGVAEDLTIDHVNGDGSRHRARIGTGSAKLYRWLVASGFPDGFQTLCAPCNTSKGRHERCRLDHAASVPGLSADRTVDAGDALAPAGGGAR
jgi:5-methylcytosine-specific restriction endonuclease McrA